jgi:quercetin dioxygenase-like cupin family protein
MLRVFHNRRTWRWACGAGALLAVSIVALAPAGVSAQVQRTVLAQGREELPADELMFKLNEVSIPAGQPGVTQAHPSGFDYAVEGTEALTVGGTPHVTAVGQATWIGPQEEHTHAEAGGGVRFWVLAVRPASTRGVQPTWPYPGARIVGESENFQLATAGLYDQVLSEIRLPRPGDSTGALAQRGPVGVAIVEGQVSMGGRALPPGALAIQSPGGREVLTNTGAGPARLLALAVSPAGAAPAQLPRTGGLSAGGVPAALRVMLAAAAVGLVVLGVALGRARRPNAAGQ